MTPSIAAEKTGGLSSDVREMGNGRYEQKVRARYKSSIERAREIAVSQSEYSHPVDFAADRRSTLLAARRAKSWLVKSVFRRLSLLSTKSYLRKVFPLLKTIKTEENVTAYTSKKKRNRNR
jgi:hypothetical protein